MSTPNSTRRDPRVTTPVVLGLVLIIGFVGMALAYRGVATTDVVSYQVPFLVSGGLTGLALAGTSLALLSVHADRIDAADERRLLAQLQRDALRIRAARAEAVNAAHPPPEIATPDHPHEETR